MIGQYNISKGEGKTNFIGCIIIIFNEKIMTFNLKNYILIYGFTLLFHVIIEMLLYTRDITINLYFGSNFNFLNYLIDYILRVILFVAIINSFCSIGNYFFKDFSFVTKKALKRMYFVGVLLIYYDIIIETKKFYGIEQIRNFYEAVSIVIIYVMFIFLIYLYTGQMRNKEKTEGKMRKLFFKSGGGITHLSNLVDEYQEMKNKIYVPIL